MRAKSGKKCPECNSCLDLIWMIPRRFFHCWFCDEFYDVVDGEVVVFDVEAETGISAADVRLVLEKNG